MRIAGLVLGLLGSLILLGIGALWTEEADHIKDVEEMALTYQKMVQDASSASGQKVEETSTHKDLMRTLAVVRGKAKASYPMFGCGVGAFIASFFVFKLPRASGAIMGVAVLVPAFLYAGSLLVSFPLALGALFSVLSKPKPRPSGTGA
ncbi:MAG: hypothetical protein HYX75_02060 [Acidobacteria bacterium]|nr:hypothetical protein [Acidobacteriota bacterium]